MTLLDLELHCHTRYSPDSLVKLPELIEHARRVGLHRLAITDHSEIEGALLAHEMAPDLIIVGEEAMTQEGELLCLFIHERIPPGLPLMEAIERVHAQGGICGPSHPLDPRRMGIGLENLLRYAPHFDFIEVFNARLRDPDKNAEAARIALECGVPGICTSDAHTLAEVGISRTRIRPYTSPQDFVAALREAELVPHYSSIMANVGSRLAALVRELKLLR
ncbi:MAG: PHP domain-containing protein [Thermoflexales bacterium]|nr:PHP domain-containing protein [Thermoflexales bacterium]MCX7940127.1 PHP domain-containing protein [Thermoflexales bacterium]MDW8054416.1 PHP domain-containing protein [Anaerolineae bacterium]MDW8292778.1 PHP domain-containing protein [Anaerolineae bacterium]